MVRPARRADARRAGLCRRRAAAGADRHRLRSRLAVVLAQRPGLVRAGRQRRRPAQRDLPLRAERARIRLHLPRLAADLEHAADHRRRRPHQPLLRPLRRRLHRRVRAGVDEQHPATGNPLPGQRPLGDLRPDRSRRPRPLHRQPPEQRAAEGLGRRRHLAHRLQPGGGGAGADGDDRAADGLDLQRRPAGGETRLARGLAGARRQPLAHHLEDRRPQRPAGDRRRHRAGHRPGDRRGGDAGDDLRLGRLRAEPRRRPDLHLRALAAAGADDRQEHRPAQLAAGQRDPVRDRRRPALLGRHLLAHRLLRPPGDAQVRDRLMLLQQKEQKGAAEGSATWALSDRIGLAVCWALGLLFCAIAVAIVVYLLVQGIKFLRPEMLWTPAAAGFSEGETGGFSDALLGTMIVAVMGIALALPTGIAVAVWLVEYGRPAPLARITAVTIEAIAGIPSIVLALFGTVIFSSTALGFLSRTSDGVVFGRSFFAASAMLSLVALPLIVASVREGLNSIPRHVREASYAVGKTKAATTRRILLPTCRPQVATGAMLGLGRIIGDTAIIVVLLGATQNFAPVEGVGFPLDILRGAGTTLTNFVYEASPTGNLNQPQKAYAAAFVLLLMVLALNAAVDVVHRRARKVGTWSH